jgi:hypothetical protein
MCTQVHVKPNRGLAACQISLQMCRMLLLTKCRSTLQDACYNKGSDMSTSFLGAQSPNDPILTRQESKGGAERTFFFQNGKTEFHYPRATKLQEFDNSNNPTPKRNRHADSHIGMNTEGSDQRVNLTDEPLLAQNKNSKSRSSQPADTKSPISLNLLHARWQNILPAHRLRSVL